MKAARSTTALNTADKAPTGIPGFDVITAGGLPRGRATLLTGGPGSGKTVFGIQFLVHGARVCGEHGIFVAFEESPARLVANTEGFGWMLAELLPHKLYFLDARPKPDMMQSGSFDLGGLLAALGAQARKMRARRVVFDALDILLAFLPDPADRRRELYRLHEWLLAHELTGLITAKAGGDEASSLGQQPFGFMQFMVDCSVILTHRVVHEASERSLRLQKFRGSGFNENEVPYAIGRHGFSIPRNARANRA